MAKAIQFPCPACGATLRLPLEMAAAQGPCPLCRTAIIAPNPTLGLASRLPPPKSLPTPAIVPTENVAPTPAATPPAPLAAPLAAPPPAPQHTSGSSHTAILVLSCLLTAVVFLIAGYLIGARFTPAAHPVVPPSTPVQPPAPVHPPTASPAATSDPVPLIIEPAATPQPDPQPAKASAAAEAALKAFLDAPDWASRAAHVLSSESLLAEMETYSRTVPDGPTPYLSVSIQNSYTDKHTGNTLFIYQIVTDDHPDGFPVAISETPDGWRVDWKTFVEFRDDQFTKFANGPSAESSCFHLIVSAPSPSRAENTENEHFSSFLLGPPLPDRQRIAYVKKTSPILATLTEATSNGAIFTPVLELAQRKTPDGKTYLEITAIPATDWLPR